MDHIVPDLILQMSVRDPYVSHFHRLEKRSQLLNSPS